MHSILDRTVQLTANNVYPIDLVYLNIKIMYIMDEVAHSQVEEMVNLVIMLVDVRIVLIDMVVFVNNSGKERYDVGCENVTATEQHVYET